MKLQFGSTRLRPAVARASAARGQGSAHSAERDVCHYPWIPALSQGTFATVTALPAMVEREGS
jgi:hypothetical protein